MRDKEQGFSIDDVRKHVEAVQNDIAKKESRIEIVSPLLIGACVSCGKPLEDPGDPSHLCVKCKEKVNRELYKFKKKKRKAQSSNKKMSGRMVLHVNQIHQIGD